MEEMQGGRERAKEKRNGRGKDGREGGREGKEQTNEQTNERKKKELLFISQGK